MGNIFELIRYGFAGYLFLATIIVSFYRIEILPQGKSFYAEWGNIIGATLLVIGPIIGFVIHQIYFVWFERTETYTDIKRGSLKILYDNYLKRKGNSLSETDKDKVKKSCYLAWKYLLTGMMGDAKTSDIFLSRLSNLRNYSHAFGAIVTSGIISFVTYAILILFNICSHHLSWIDIIIPLSTVIVMVLFGYQRHGLIERIEELEIGIMKLQIEKFTTALEEIIILEKKFDPTLQQTDSNPAANK